MLLNFIIKRGISTTLPREGKRNFKKFLTYNKRGTRVFKERQMTDPILPIYRYGGKNVGIKDEHGNWTAVPEKIPELVVPDLTDFKLKPYVSYRAPEVIQSEFTAQDLFNVIYGPKILEDFKSGKLDENGQPLEPSDNEKMTPEEAQNKAKVTGTDLFTSGR